MWKSMPYAPADCKGQRSSFYSGIDNWRLTVENEKHRKLLWQSLFLPQPKQKETALTGGHWEELFVEPLAVEPVLIPSASAGSLEPIT